MLKFRSGYFRRAVCRVALLVLALAICAAAQAATLAVNSLGDDVIAGDGVVTLREAITAANADAATDLGESGNGADVIDLSGVTGTIALNAALPPIASDITLRGVSRTAIVIRGSHSADASDDGIFFVAANGALTLENLTLTGGLSRGGDGADVARDGAGGGAAGLGGAVLVSNGVFTATNVDFTDNHAIGGTGGSTNGPIGVFGAGGGGGFGADAPAIPDDEFGGNGGNGGPFGNTGGGGGTVGNGGYAGSGGDGGGGGGGGTGIATHGGNGGFAGGGGGAGWAHCGAGPAGAGGFGGGGGGGNVCEIDGFVLAAGGTGGLFGGKGGDGLSGPDGGGGGGGAGLGGAIFLRSGASATLLNCRFTNNGAQRGIGGGAGNYNGVAGNAGGNGQGKGGAIFAMSGASVVATGATFIGNGADDAGALNTDNADIYGNISFAQGTAIGLERSTLQVHAGTFLLHIPVHIVTSDGQPTTEAASVDYSTADGSAHSDTDYVIAHGTLTFRPGTASGTTIDIDIELLDSGIEPTRAFGVNLSNFGAAYADAVASEAIVLEATDTIFAADFEPTLQPN